MSRRHIGKKYAMSWRNRVNLQRLIQWRICGHMTRQLVNELKFQEVFSKALLEDCEKAYLERLKDKTLPMKVGEALPLLWFAGVYICTVSKLSYADIQTRFPNENVDFNAEWPCEPKIYAKMCAEMRGKFVPETKSFEFNRTELEKWVPLIDFIQRSLNKLRKFPLLDDTSAHRVVVYRGINIRIDKRKLYKRNSEVSWPAFSSTSIDGNVALEYMNKNSTGHFFAFAAIPHHRLCRHCIRCKGRFPVLFSVSFKRCPLNTYLLFCTDF